MALTFLSLLDCSNSIIDSFVYAFIFNKVISTMNEKMQRIYISVTPIGNIVSGV